MLYKLDAEGKFIHGSTPAVMTFLMTYTPGDLHPLSFFTTKKRFKETALLVDLKTLTAFMEGEEAGEKYEIAKEELTNSDVEEQIRIYSDHIKKYIKSKDVQELFKKSNFKDPAFFNAYKLVLIAINDFLISLLNLNRYEEMLEVSEVFLRFLIKIHAIFDEKETNKAVKEGKEIIQARIFQFMPNMAITYAEMGETLLAKNLAETSIQYAPNKIKQDFIEHQEACHNMVDGFSALYFARNKSLPQALRIIDKIHERHRNFNETIIKRFNDGKITLITFKNSFRSHIAQIGFYIAELYEKDEKYYQAYHLLQKIHDICFLNFVSNTKPIVNNTLLRPSSSQLFSNITLDEKRAQHTAKSTELSKLIFIALEKQLKETKTDLLNPQDPYTLLPQSSPTIILTFTNPEARTFFIDQLPNSPSITSLKGTKLMLRDLCDYTNELWLVNALEKAEQAYRKSLELEPAPLPLTLSSVVSEEKAKEEFILAQSTSLSSSSSSSSSSSAPIAYEEDIYKPQKTKIRRAPKKEATSTKTISTLKEPPLRLTWPNGLFYSSQNPASPIKPLGSNNVLFAVLDVTKLRTAGISDALILKAWDILSVGRLGRSGQGVVPCIADAKAKGYTYKIKMLGEHGDVRFFGGPAGHANENHSQLLVFNACALKSHTKRPLPDFDATITEENTHLPTRMQKI